MAHHQCSEATDWPQGLPSLSNAPFKKTPVCLKGRVTAVGGIRSSSAGYSQTVTIFKPAPCWSWKLLSCLHMDAEAQPLGPLRCFLRCFTGSWIRVRVAGARTRGHGGCRTASGSLILCATMLGPSTPLNAEIQTGNLKMVFQLTHETSEIKTETVL